MKRAVLPVLPVLLGALVLLALVATALPFLPGRHDPLAVQLSVLARGLGIASMLLVPVGLAGLVREAMLPSQEVRERSSAFAWAILVAGSLAALLTALFALGLSGAALATVVLASWSIALWRGSSPLARWARGPRRRDLGAASALVLAPCALAGGQLALSDPLTSLARHRAMDGTAELIADIEQFREANGQYPRSLFAEWPDYRPNVIGVSGYLYEPSGDSYRLAVEVPNFTLDSRVFLSYDPTDRHVMASHDADLLRRTPAELPLYRGYSQMRELDRPHWVALYFD